MKRPSLSGILHSRALFLFGCVLGGLGIAGVIMAACGYPVGAAYGALWTGATGIQTGPADGLSQIGFVIAGRQVHIHLFLFAQSLARATPLILTGLAVAVGLRAGLFNIGAQGQMVLGALGAAVAGQAHGLSPAIHVPLVLLTGAAVGACWGAIPALLKSRRGVHEVLSTILLNYVAVNLAAYLILHGLKDPERMAAETREIAASAWLGTAPFALQSNLTGGFLIAVVAAVGFAALLPWTAWGYRLRAVGLGPEAAEAAGIKVDRTRIFAMALSGALAGAAGAIEVMSVHHRYVEGVAATYGFDGIAVALLGGLSGIGVLVSALFFGALESGAAFMESQTNVPADLAVIVEGIVILFAGIRLVRRSRAREHIEEGRQATDVSA